MDFVSGALPNVMFIAGLVAVGIALGIEFKIVEIKGQLSKNGRIGTFVLGILLIVVSVRLYTEKNVQTASLPTAPAAPAAIQSNLAAGLPTTPPPAQPTAAPAQPTAVPPAPAQSGVAVEIQGTVRQIAAQGNQMLIVIDQTGYLLPADAVASLGSALRVGTNLKLVGTQLPDGTITVANVVVYSTGKPGKGDKHDD